MCRMCRRAHYGSFAVGALHDGGEEIGRSWGTSSGCFLGSVLLFLPELLVNDRRPVGPEPGGLTPRQVIGMIQALEGKIVGADVVEVNPIRDHNNLTGALAAKLVKELAAALISR